jgi:mono/diheme cytochrome c family protein
MIKRLILILAIVITPFLIGLLFTYDIIKPEWVSTMKIQQVAEPQRDPLPLPQRSIPIQGAAYISDLGAPVNPVAGDNISLTRGKQLFETDCALCHGKDGKGVGPFAPFLTQFKPANLVDEDVKNLSDGEIFVTISDGVAGRMPALRENLPAARERWDVVNYVRSLQQK